MSNIQFGRVQLRIMQILWRKKSANAREIADELNKIAPIAHSTVQTLLRKLELKGAIDHNIDDRTFIFYPLVESDNVTGYKTQDFMDSMFAGSPSGMVSYLLKHEKISPEELSKIRKLINEKGIEQ
jgi:BlaI family transcriptional regulator, penicillinase repressor